MSVAKLIREFIEEIGPNHIFLSRQLLHLGSRNAVDITLSRMVQQKYIKRLAAGVFIVQAVEDEPPSVSSIAEAKARSFSRITYIDENQCNQGITSFLTDGCNSSFKSVQSRVKFQHLPPRRLHEFIHDKMHIEKKAERIESISILEEDQTSIKAESCVKLLLGLNLINSLLEALAKPNIPDPSVRNTYTPRFPCTATRGFL